MTLAKDHVPIFIYPKASVCRRCLSVVLYIVLHICVLVRVRTFAHNVCNVGFLTKWFRETFREMFREKRFAISRNMMGRFACFAVSRNGPFRRNMFRETAK
jgi:hypothetical protein